LFPQKGADNVFPYGISSEMGPFDGVMYAVALGNSEECTMW